MGNINLETILELTVYCITFLQIPLPLQILYTP